jgi:hypothetical protein
MEEISAIQMFEIIRREGVERGERMDKAISDSNELSMVSHSLLREELADVKKILENHTIDIEFINDLKKKANWGWSTAKFLAMVAGWIAGIVVSLYEGWQFLREYFLKNG